MDASEGELSEAALEQQLQDHLVEQRASLCALDEALACDPHNEELVEVHVELCAALKSAEESLLQLKRSRLLREIDVVLDARASESKSTQEDSKVLSSEVALGGDSRFVSGSKCRFQYSDGRWYNGQIMEFDSEGLARVLFLTPTAEKMQICKFYMQQRCRFGENCRMSHGYLVSPDMLKQYNLLTWQQPCVGSVVLACSSLKGEGIWRQAELESWNETLRSGSAVFVNDGSRLEVGMENLCLSEYAEVTDAESTSSEEEDEEEEEELEEVEDDGYYSFLGLGAVGMAGPQTDTQIFANWEKHTRGVASKMMVNMGYREGMGLGRTGQGIVLPLQVRVLPKHRSLDFIGKGEEIDLSKGKKKSRGGKRKRDKKLADAARSAKADKSKSLDVFGFINNQLSAQKGFEGEENEAGMRLREGKVGNQRQVKAKTHKDDRRSLMAQADEVTELRSKVEKLEEMALRNRKDKAVHEAVSRKLHEARKDLLKAEANHASASLAVHSKENEKKWLRF